MNIKKGVEMVKRCRRQKGFTLIELMIVMVVIAILVGIILPTFRGMQDEANVTKAKGDLRTLQVALESYFIHHNNAYPANLSDLTTAEPTIVNAIPDDPFNPGNSYGYVASANDQYYVCYSMGPGLDGSATITATGEVTETNGSSCVFVSNSTIDAQP